MMSLWATLTLLLTEDHEFKVVAIDSLDWLETLLWDHVCQKNGWADISSPAYGKGYTICFRRVERLP